MIDEEKSDIQKELELMAQSLTEGISEEPKIGEPEVKEPEPKIEEKEPESKIEAKESEPEPKVEEPKVEHPPEVPDERDKTIADLRAKLAEKESIKEPEKKPEPTPEPPLTLEEQDFIGGLDFDDLSRDPKEFNKLLNKLYQKSVTETRKVLGEGILRSIPDIVRNNLTMMNDLQKMSEKFYTENEDLKPFKKVVAAVFEEIAAENPDKRYDEVVKQVAPEVRKRLELHEKVSSKDAKKTDPPPSLPHKGGKVGRSQDKPSIEPLQVELEEMNKILRR